MSRATSGERRSAPFQRRKPLRTLGITRQVSPSAQNKTPRSRDLATVELKLRERDSGLRLRGYSRSTKTCAEVRRGSHCLADRKRLELANHCHLNVLCHSKREERSFRGISCSGRVVPVWLVRALKRAAASLRYTLGILESSASSRSNARPSFLTIRDCTDQNELLIAILTFGPET